MRAAIVSTFSCQAIVQKSVTPVEFAVGHCVAMKVGEWVLK